MSNIIDFPKFKDFSKVTFYEFLCECEGRDRTKKEECGEFYIVFDRYGHVIGFVYFSIFTFDGRDWCGVYSMLRGQDQFNLIAGVEPEEITTKKEKEIEEVARAMLDGFRCEARYVVDVVEFL